MTTWTADSVSEKIRSSDAWVARAIYRLSTDFASLPKETVDAIPTAKDDKMFFDTLRQFFSENGYFTDRHIAIGRAKLRKPYVEYLAQRAND